MAGPPQRRRSRREWGWHPLTESWANRIVAAAEVGRGDLVLDLGAGTGALTRPLLASGARVLAIELHTGRVAALRALEAERLTVVQADLAELRLPRRPFRVVSNPPYAGSLPLIGRLLVPGSRLVGADLVLQLGVARAVLAGRPGGRWQRAFEARILDRLPRSAFLHQPGVDSVVLRISRRGR